MKKIRVLVQAGHLAPREPGFESGTGTAGEIEVVKAIRDKLVAILRNDGRFEPIPMPGHITPRGIKVDAALFLHCDGSGNPSASGYCFGYPSYRANGRLAVLLDQEFKGIPGHPPHHADNYTRDMQGYYGYSRVDTSGPEVLIEHGFLTNPQERVWINRNIDALARAEYRALLRYFSLQPPTPPKSKPYQLYKYHKDGTAVVLPTGKAGVLYAVGLLFRGQFKSIKIDRS